MGKKATNVEVDFRVDRIARLLVNCSTRSDIIQYARKEWGIGRAQTDKYIARARQIIRDDYAVERADFLATRLGALDIVVKEAIKSNQLNCVVGALRLQADLTMGAYVHK